MFIFREAHVGVGGDRGKSGVFTEIGLVDRELKSLETEDVSEDFVLYFAPL